MADTREKFSPLTIAFHWVVALTIIGLLAVGIYMVDWPKGEFRSWLYGWHKVIGTTVLMVAMLRVAWRWRNGLPAPAGRTPGWQERLARATHITLLAATIALPLTGAIYSYAGGYPVPILGLAELKSATKYPLAFDVFKFIHGWAGWILVAIVALHFAGALKHHLVDRDGTLRRMLGARIA